MFVFTSRELNRQFKTFDNTPALFHHAQGEQGVEAWLKLTSSQAVRIRLTSRNFFAEINIFTYNRKKHKASKKLITNVAEKLDPKNCVEVTNVAENLDPNNFVNLNKIKEILSEHFSVWLENFFLKTKMFKESHMYIINFFIGVSYQYNYLLIIIIFFSYLYRISLLDTTSLESNGKTNHNIYCKVNVSSYKGEKPVNFRLKYLLPTCTISNNFIEKIYLSQKKNEKSLTKEQIINDFIAHRLEFSNKLKHFTITIYFYIMSPFAFLLAKICLINLYCISLKIFKICFSYGSVSNVIIIKNKTICNLISISKLLAIVAFFFIFNSLIVQKTFKAARSVDVFVMDTSVNGINYLNAKNPKI